MPLTVDLNPIRLRVQHRCKLLRSVLPKNHIRRTIANMSQTYYIQNNIKNCMIDINKTLKTSINGIPVKLHPNNLAISFNANINAERSLSLAKRKCIKYTIDRWLKHHNKKM